MLDGEHPYRAFEAHDRHSREAVEPLLAGFRAIDELRVLGGLGEVEDSPLGGDGPDQALAHPHPGDVHRFLPQAVSREQLEIIVPEQVDRADVAGERLGDEVDDLVELGLRRAALRHHVVEAGQDLASGGSCGGGHRRRAIRWGAGLSRGGI